MSKHTPGPWRMLEQAAPILPVMVKIVAPYANYDVVAKDVLIKDARLIAAAPELLEKAKRVCEQLAVGSMSKDEAFMGLRKAIAKAEGTDAD